MLIDYIYFNNNFDASAQWIKQDSTCGLGWVAPHYVVATGAVENISSSSFRTWGLVDVVGLRGVLSTASDPHYQVIPVGLAW